MSDRHPSCIHSTGHHNSMTQGSAASTCTCEDCSRYKVMPSFNEQFSASNDLEQQHYSTSCSSNTDSRRDPSSTATSSSPPTTYLARRSSTVKNPNSANQSGDTATSPRMQPAGFGLASRSGGIGLPQRRSSLEFHNRERSFQQHSTACDCGGSGVGCGCAFTCDC
ncbi:hypothetical protein BGZ96_006496 [Linnemannia gamsii]|uniref:Uncharacterized protein n=1 Tax=Linnemannia gamsii TaxID=64522 RepID=A0ABQ7K2W1_9FUNG|nr:hypothetical protein BGZ96_006496 [Linnemannia gamsii]